MCTIMTITRDQFTPEVIDQILQDAKDNPHGFALVLTKWGELTGVVRSMDFGTIIDALSGKDWGRMFLHCRYATFGEHKVQNCHGWESGDFIYMHNGVLVEPDAYNYPVDSMIIGTWLRDGVEKALWELRAEDYANVFLIDTAKNVFTVSRSYANSLFTDGYGSYSTNAVGPIKFPVDQWRVDVLFIDPDGDEGVVWVDEDSYFKSEVPTDGLEYPDTSRAWYNQSAVNYDWRTGYTQPIGSSVLMDLPETTEGLVNHPETVATSNLSPERRSVLALDSFIAPAGNVIDVLPDGRMTDRQFDLFVSYLEQVGLYPFSRVDDMDWFHETFEPGYFDAVNDPSEDSDDGDGETGDREASLAIDGKTGRVYVKKAS